MISKKMKYALKALIEIAKNKDEFISATLIAQQANIPIKFLEQILTDLRKGRFVSSKKGSLGGYYLLKQPETITLADIYRLIDGPIALVSCASLTFYEPCADCPDESTCSIHHALVQVRKETLKALQQLTLEDLVMGVPAQSSGNWVI